MTRARDLGDFIADGAAAELVVDTTTLVVDSTNNRVGIGTASPATALDVVGNVTITTTDTTTQLSIVSTDAGSSTGPRFELIRNSASPAANDILGEIRFLGEDSAGSSLNYVRIFSQLIDPTDGSEDGSLEIDVRQGGTHKSRILSNATETVFNDDSADLDFRVESNGNANMLFVDGGNNAVVIGGATVTDSNLLNIQGSSVSSNIGVVFNDTNTSKIYGIQNGGSDLKFFDYTANAERFRIGTSGQLGIGGATYGTSGQVLTSGGSGAAPSWVDASGGGGIELTTSEAVVEGDPLAWNFTTGKVEKILRTGSNGRGTPSISGRTVSQIKTMLYITEIDKWAIIFHDASNSPTGHYVAIGTQATSGTITWGAALRIQNVTSNRTGSTMVYDPNVSRLLVIARMDNGSGKAQTYSISGTTLTSTAESNFETANTNINYTNACASHYHAASNKIIVFYHMDSGNASTLRVFTLGSSSITVSARQGPNSVTGGAGFYNNAGGMQFAINSLGNNIYMAYKSSSTHKAIAATISGTTLSFGSDTDIGHGDAVAGSNGYGKLIYLSGSSTSNLFASFLGGAGNSMYAYHFTVSGTTITQSTKVNMDASASYGCPAVGYDGTNDHSYLGWKPNGSYVRADQSSSPNTFNAPDGYTQFSGTESGDMLMGQYNPDVGLFTFAMSQTFYYYYAPIIDNFYYFVGVAKEAASANTTVKIANAGQIATGLSGLTAGRTYKINFSGGWTNYGNAISDPTAFANPTQRGNTNGVALTTTTMLLWNDMTSS